jgi:hypothetical protein
MMGLYQFAKKRKADGREFKVIILFDSVSDSLYNNQRTNNLIDKKQAITVNKADFDKFLIALTVQYEFDYIELYQYTEIIDYLKEMH